MIDYVIIFLYTFTVSFPYNEQITRIQKET